METRSRKRAEAAAQGPLTRGKLSRLCTSQDSLKLVSANRVKPSVSSGKQSKRKRSGVEDTRGVKSTELTPAYKVAAKMEPESGELANLGDDDLKREELGKGKQEANDRDVEREWDRERMRHMRERVAAAAASGGFDEDQDREGVALHHNSLASASNALNGLLRKLGAGLDELLPSTASGSLQSSRLKSILSGLRAEGDESRQLDALSQLCELLSIGTEESLSSFSVDSFVPLLVGLLSCEYNPDIMLLAARALTHLCDVLPSSCAAVVHYGAVPCFCARLLTIEYIDLAEQSLQALSKISHEHPAACLRAGGLMAVLSYLDFLPTGVQRVAVCTAANICRQLPADMTDTVMEAVPILTNLLQCQDSKVMEYACLSLSRIADAVAPSAEKLDRLCSHGLISQALRLVSVTTVPQTTLSSSTYTGLIRLIGTCASGSPSICENLLLLGVSSTLRDILTGPANGPSSLLTRPSEQLYEIVSLVNELLPAIPEPSIVTPAVATSGSLTRRRSAVKPVGGIKCDDEGNALLSPPSPVQKLLADQPSLLEKFGKDLFPILIQVHESSINPSVQQKCLLAQSKVIYWGVPTVLEPLLHESNVSSFLAGVLAAKDGSIIVSALKMSEMLMQKLPDVFRRSFVKEGVVHAIDSLLALEQSSTSVEPSANSPQSLFKTSAPQHLTRRGGASRKGRAPAHPGVAQEENAAPSADAASLAVSSGGGEALPQSAPDGQARHSRHGLRASAYARARSFKDTYFPSDAGALESDLLESLRKLQELCSRLQVGCSPVATKGKGKKSVSSLSTPRSDEEDLRTVAEILAILLDGDGVSTFEFVCSGVASSLLSYFSAGSTLVKGVRSDNFENIEDQAKSRLMQFVELTLPISGSSSDAPMLTLIRRLQSALASLERFPLMLSQAARGPSGQLSVGAGLTALTQPFKLCLSREVPSDKLLRDYSSNVVLIEPLATLSAVEDFLWPRVKRHDLAATSVPSAGLPPSLPVASVAAEAGSQGSLLAAPSDGTQQRRSSRLLAALEGSLSSPMSNELGAAKSVAGSLENDIAKLDKQAAPVASPSTSGPLTRTAAARQRAAAAQRTENEDDSDLKASQGDTGAEPLSMDVDGKSDDDKINDDDDERDEEEEDEDPDDDHDDDEEIEDDDADEEVFEEDVPPPCGPDRVHDVQLGEGPELTPSDSASASAPGEDLPQALPSQSQVEADEEKADAGKAQAEKAGPSGTSLSSALGNASEHTFNPVMGPRGTRSHNRKALGTAAVAPSPQPKLMFSLRGKTLDASTTILQAIQQAATTDAEDEETLATTEYGAAPSARRLWDEVYTISYRRVDTQESSQNAKEEATTSHAGALGPVEEDALGQTHSSHGVSPGGFWHDAALIETVLSSSLPCGLDKSNPAYSVLVLLRVLHHLNRVAPQLHAHIRARKTGGQGDSSPEILERACPVVDASEFVSTKLSPKLSRQMQDALALCSGGLPAWCQQLVSTCPFLFSMEARRQYFNATAFGLSRALHRLQQQQTIEGGVPASHRETRDLRVGRLQRQKVRVSRTRILDSAAKVMELYGSSKAVLEVEYFGEVGTGLGPTLEFFTLLSQELQRTSLNMWRTDVPPPPDPASKKRRCEEYVTCPLGLFPLPLASLPNSGAQNRTERHFRLLGKVVAKALQDSRLLDMSFSPAFYKLILNQELGLYDIKTIDPSLGCTLEEFQALSVRKSRLEAENAFDPSLITFRGTRLEDLCLNFTLPGYPLVALKPGGADIMLTHENLEEYVSLVVDATVCSGVAVQIGAFREGFNQVFQLNSLQIFSEDELDSILCGHKELWTPNVLAEHLKFDHGYTASSPPILNLLEVMCELSPEDQRAFLRFVTGAPQLPPGGLASLSPKFTIVRKHPTGSSTAVTAPGAVIGQGTMLADKDLPSVMTCANYLKLPPYSCKAVMRDRLLYAIKEGQGSFDLS